RDNLLVSGEIRLIVNIDHFQIVSALQVLLAHALDILERDLRLHRRAADIQAQDVLALARTGDLRERLPQTDLFAHRHPSSCSARPTNTRSVLERSPMICRTACGSLMTSVGMATICAPRACSGCSSRSITS